MSQEKVLKTLESLGLSQSDAQVYVFLGKKGPQKARDIIKVLRMPKQQLYVVLKNLQSRGILNASLERPAKFSAVPFEKVLDLFVKARMEEAQRIQQGKNEILSDWQSIAVGETSDKSAKFTVLEGRNYIYSKIKQMMEETENQLSVISSVPGLVRADQFGLLDAAHSHASKSKLRLRFLTELSEQNASSMEGLLDRTRRTGFSFEGRVPELGLKLFTRIVIRDGEEAVFFVTPEMGADEKTDVCLWTDCKSLVNSFLAVFEELWHNSTDIQKKIIMIKTGKPTPKSILITDAGTAKRTYDEALHAASKEIIMLASSAGLSAIQKEIELIKRESQKNLSVRIMAPITNENLHAAQELSKTCVIRHVSASYLETTIVDGKHVFQFKRQPTEFENLDETPCLEDVFYTNDIEQVEKTKNMLNSLWQSARTPPVLKLGLVASPSIRSVAPVSDNEYSISKPASAYRKMATFVKETPEVVTEEEVLNKIINGKKYPAKNWPKDILRFYGSCANAAIHPPEYLNLPSLLVCAYNWNEQSSFGAEELLIIYLWSKAPKGFGYNFSAAVTNNPRAIKIRKEVAAGTPAEKNVQLVKKNQLQIRVHGNTAFVGWTVPIRLFPSSYVLPPAGILIEGYGRLKTSVTYFKAKSGVKMTFEGNGHDAFVTFFHPISKYAGPGTDGIVARDEVATYSM